MTTAVSTGTVVETMVHASSRVHYIRPEPRGYVYYVDPNKSALEDERGHLEDIRQAISRLWATDWDSPEDAVYDTW